MAKVYLRLNGPGHDKAKAPAAYGWQSPGFQGLGKAALERLLAKGAWIGMRTDDYVVIDCDNEAAFDWWLNNAGKDAAKTWTRKTPHGFHFIYDRTAGSPETTLIRPFKGVELDVLAGSGRQIVLWAEGYETISPDHTTMPFYPPWLPSSAYAAKDFSDEAWDEMPEGRGNDTLTAIGGVMRRHGASYEVILKSLAGINKLTMTTDPMPIDQIDQIARSVCRYSPASMQDIVLVEEKS